MRPLRHMALLLPFLLASVSTAVRASADDWCTIANEITLSDCAEKCPADQACAQYPAAKESKCNNNTRNVCATNEDETCMYQCLPVYRASDSAWTLFVKEPAKTDAYNSATLNLPFPAALISNIPKYQISEDVKIVQIAGYDAITIAKGSTVSVSFNTKFFDKASTVETLYLTSLDLSKISANFLPKSVSTLVMDNCLLTSVPSDVQGMKNLRTLNMSKNSISELTTDSSTLATLQSLTTLNLRANELKSFDWILPELTVLDLRDNKLKEFPTSIFNMTKLITVYLDGNSLPTLSLTESQVLFLNRFTKDSSLGVPAAVTCDDGQTQSTVLGATVCVKTAAASTSAPSSGGSSSNVLMIVCIVLGVLVVVGVGAFVWYRRRSKANSEFYVSVMENNTAGSNVNGSTTGQSRRSNVFNRGGRGQSTGGRPARGISNASRQGSIINRPSKATSSIGSYADLGKYQEDLSRGSGTGASQSLSLVGGTRQRERGQINQNVVRVSSQDITYTRTIAKGAFGEVWLASYGRDLVAVKKLLSHDATNVGDFIAELNLLASLSHPRILALVGACWEDDLSDLQIVTEYMDSGDLLTVLRRTSPAEMTWDKTKATYCLHVCEAVYYLHSLQPALIHRDIKSRNILIDERKGAKLSDFGESRERTIQNTMTAGVGTARWVAPEIILGYDYSELADIYSLGVLLTELDTHQIPFETLGLEEHTIVQQVAIGKLRPKVSDSCPEVIRRLAHECLQFDPQLRPSAARVLQTLMASPLVRRLSTISDSE